MNLQAPMAGPYTRQVSNQGGTSLPAIPPQQQNMMPNSEGGSHAPLAMEHARQFIQDRIYKSLMQRLTREMAPKNVQDIVKRLEEGLFKSATSMEEYLNLDTLDNRLQALIKRTSMGNQNQRYQQQSNASVSMSTMIPTPGMPQSGNSNSMLSSAVMSSFTLAGGQRIGSQMMPTPGFNTSNNGTSNQSYVKLEPTNNVSVISNADPAMVSQPLQQKQQAGGQNSRILHNLGSHMNGGIRSTLAQKSYGFPNGSLNGNLGMMGKTLPMVNSLGNTEGFLTDSHYGNSPKVAPQYFDQHQGQTSQGDGSGNFFVPTTSSTSIMNMNPNLSAIQRTSSPMVVNQLNLHNSDQPANLKPSAEDMNFQTQHLQIQQQLIQSQRQQNQRLPYGQTPLISDLGSRIKSEPQVYEQFQPSRGSQLHAISSGSQDMSVSMPQTSEQQQIGGQSLQGQGHSRLQEPSNQFGKSSHEMKIEECFQDQYQKNKLSSEASMTANASVDVPSGRQLQFKNQQRWLLLMRHARKCGYPPGKCPEN
ncbi:hypothetical protein E3N88_45341 [Mikania micrantha]|uniref:histone acetyltransferase n=1 Tax=Mikania micrantha TaxID=192012 RepID=A0A5N6L9J4_9ASTR|nr:hypothetical protein E3N88_45341 [Mikania micrantha]